MEIKFIIKNIILLLKTEIYQIIKKDKIQLIKREKIKNRKFNLIF